jgi:nucleoside-diphosphate-sugar epimerase
MADKKVVIAGATGLVGNAALRHFGGAGGCDIVALSRRKPRELHGARHVSIDLTDPAQCTQAATALKDTTHLVYAALYEAPNLIDGWRDPDQIRTNDSMLRNLMAALEPVAPGLRHVALLQGTKAYGVHVRPLNVPAREGRSEMYEQPNFYWAQENFLRELQQGKTRQGKTQQGKTWHWSILRPVLIVGEAIGGAMDLIPPLGVYAAMLRGQGRPLDYPGGAARVSQAVDVDLLARAIAWSGEAAAARNEAFSFYLGECLALDCRSARHGARQTGAVVAGAGISEMDRAVERAAPHARSGFAGAGSVRRAVVSVRRLQHALWPDPAGAALDRFDRQDQPGRLHRDDGYRGDVPQMVHPCAGEPAVALN